MAENPRTDGANPRAPESRMESLVDDALGVDFKAPRTIRDLILRPGRVADAALAGDRRRYSPPLRFFLALFAVQTLTFGWSGLNDANTMSSIYADNPAGLARLSARLAELGSSVAEADALMLQWSAWANWPIAVAASLIFVLVIWATRPRLGLFKAFMLYLVASNASNLLALPLMLAAILVGQSALFASAAVAIVSFFVYGGLVLHRRAADTALGLVLRIAALVASILPVAIAVLALFIAVTEIAFKTQIGASRIGLLMETLQPPDPAAARPETPGTP